MNPKTALLFGATGLTGSHLLQLLLNDDTYNKVVIFVRKTLDITHPKLKQVLTNLKDLTHIAEMMVGDDLFCCLGTTIGKAGSQEAFKMVDYSLPVHLAEIAHKNKVTAFICVSSLGADAKSSNFYLRTKGEMEEAVASFKINKTVFVRPSMLLGDRNETRVGEQIGKVLMQALSFVFVGKLKQYKAIPAEQVAKAMLKFANTPETKMVYNSEELWMNG